MATTARSRDERVAALYARVIRRVCERFEQHVAATSESATDDTRAAVAGRVETQWRERLTRYTGHAYAELVVREPSELEAAPSAREPDAAASSTSDDAAEADGDAASAMALGRPHALHQLRVTPSIFATILLGKRKMEQLDGTTEDASDGDSDGGNSNDDGNDSDQEEEKAEDEEEDRTHVSLSEPSAAPLDVSLATVLNVALVPLQCAARDVCFAYRKTAVRGRVKNVVLTLLRRVRADEEISPKHLLWLTRPVETTQDEAPTRPSHGTLVEVVEVARGGAELVVQVAGSARTHRVDVHETRRFYECVVASGYVHLRFVHS